MLSAKITRRDSDARPCSRFYDRCADGEPRRPSGTTGTTDYGARAVQKCQLSGIVPPKMPARRVDRRTKGETQIHCLQIRTSDATGLRKHCRIWSQRNQPLGARSNQQQLQVPFASAARPTHSPGTMNQATTAAHKKRRPFASGHGLRGGRWPGPQVERDGLNCYCGRGWVSDRSNNSMAAAITLGGIAAAGIVSLTSGTRPDSTRFTPHKRLLMAISAVQTTGHGRLP